MRLAEDPTPQLRPPRDGAPDAPQRGVERALPQPRQRPRRGEQEVRVGEVERRLAVLLVAAVGQRGVAVAGGDGAEVAAVGEQEVEEELGVEGPVAGVVEDEDGVDFEVWRWGGDGGGGGVGGGERAGLRGVVGLEVVREGPDGRVGGDDVGGGDDAREAVARGAYQGGSATRVYMISSAGQTERQTGGDERAGRRAGLLFRNTAAAVAMPARDQHAGVPQRRLARGAVHQVRERRVALHEEARVEGDAEAVGQLRDAGGLGLAAAVGEQDEGDALRLEVLQGARGAGEGLGAAEEDTVDAKGGRGWGQWGVWGTVRSLGTEGGGGDGLECEGEVILLAVLVRGGCCLQSPPVGSSSG